MKKFMKNNQGITLLELLLSITILSIVIVGLIAFFSNTFRVNSMNHDDLQAMNLAREIKAQIHSDADIPGEPTILADFSGWNRLSDFEQIILDYKDTNYDVFITVNKEPITNDMFPVYLVHIIVKKGEKVASETYTYYEAAVQGEAQ